MSDFFYLPKKENANQEASDNQEKKQYDFIGLESIHFKSLFPLEDGQEKPSLDIQHQEELPLVHEKKKPQDEEKQEEEKTSIPLLLLKQSLLRIQKDILQAIQIIEEQLSGTASKTPPDSSQEVLSKREEKKEFIGIADLLKITQTHEQQIINTPYGGEIIEGVFDGEKMFGEDGKQYTVPANYASKSKLVEGDTMKLTITAQGSFIYKQTNQTERRRVIATLEQDLQTRDYYARHEMKRWRILTASVTYFRGVPGDEVVLLVPGGKQSAWGAVENIIKRTATLNYSKF